MIQGAGRSSSSSNASRSMSQHSRQQNQQPPSLKHEADDDDLDDIDDMDDMDDDDHSSTFSQQPKPKRQRVSIACDLCRKKKIKCDGKTPSCSSCAANRLPCVYAQPERKQKQRKSRVSTLSLLDSRLRRIETLLETVAPLIEQNIPQLVSLASSAVKNQSLITNTNRRHRHRKNHHHQNQNDSDLDSEDAQLTDDPNSDESYSIVSTTNGDSDSESDDLDKHGPNVKLEKNDNTSACVFNDEHDTSKKQRKTLPASQSEKLKSTVDTTINASKTNQHGSLALSTAATTSTTPTASSTNDTTGKSVNVKWNVPNLPAGSYIASKFDPARAPHVEPSNIASVTVLNGFEQIYFEGVSLIFCSSHGFGWISRQLEDRALYGQLSLAFQVSQENTKTNLTNLLDSSTSPITFDKDIVLRGFQEFISGLGLWNVFSLEELDFMYFNEFGSHIPQTEKYQHAREYQKSVNKKFEEYAEEIRINTKSHPATEPNIPSAFGTPTGLNGYAEKLCVAAITAMGLSLEINSPGWVPEGMPKQAYYELVTKYITSGIYYLERLALAGHSILAVKGSLLLVSLTTCSPNFVPPWSLLSIVVRIAQNLGLHRREHYENLPPAELGYRLHAWWLLYCVEKDISLKFGRPSTIFDGNISAPLPCRIEFDVLSQHSFSNFNFLLHFVLIYRLWNRIHIELTQSRQQSSREALLKILDFDRELEKWKNSLPLALQPDSKEMPIQLNISAKFNMHDWIFRFGVTYCHAVYYYALSYIHRHVASRPSWIFRVTRVSNSEEEKSNGASDNASPALSSHTDSEKDLEQFDTETVASLLAEMRNGYKMGTVYKARTKNGIKLSVRRVAKENPRLLGSPYLVAEYSRKTIVSIMRLHPWTIPYIWRISYFGFNAFLGLFVSSSFLYSSDEAVSNIFYMRNLIDVLERLFEETRGFMFIYHPDRMLRTMVDGITAHVERKRRELNLKDPDMPEIITSEDLRKVSQEKTSEWLNNSTNRRVSPEPAPAPLLRTHSQQKSKPSQGLNKRFTHLTGEYMAAQNSSEDNTHPLSLSPPLPLQKQQQQQQQQQLPSNTPIHGPSPILATGKNLQPNSPQFLSPQVSTGPDASPAYSSSGLHVLSPLSGTTPLTEFSAAPTGYSDAQRPGYTTAATNTNIPTSSIPHSVSGSHSQQNQQQALPSQPTTEYPGIPLMDPFTTMTADTKSGDPFGGVHFMGSGSWANVDSMYNSMFGILPIPVSTEGAPSGTGTGSMTGESQGTDRHAGGGGGGGGGGGSGSGYDGAGEKRGSFGRTSFGMGFGDFDAFGGLFPEFSNTETVNGPSSSVNTAVSATTVPDIHSADSTRR
ncbi:uncharacterized protein SAPINGB_P003948 [Magnusiomyces paraingens]|uniref:Zn(2)-C6 fungal-type domain-containing protein n=1 Tax=Magnusiomyces paraingens TaxID=2606893 RepID=A0A5E8BS24_9ASCO|nr:uncharacterized protein SAPINGB_P003948 [Saprochaete ingens]VVT54183.1 unnamed protein product [Saprochaete ingens]